MTDLAQQTRDAVARRSEPTIADWIDSNRGAIESQLAGTLNSEAFVRAALTIIQGNKDLRVATPTSILGSIMLAAQLRLEIGAGLGQFWLTPRRVEGKMTCVPVIGYRGYTTLAYRSGLVAAVETVLVREGDVLRKGTDSDRGRWFVHEPIDDSDDEDRAWTGVLAMARLKAGGTVWEYLSRKAVLKRRPNGWEKGPWRTHHEPMARKTGVRALAPSMPMSIDFARALSLDEQQVEKLPGVPDLVVRRDEPRALPAGQQPADERPAGDDEAPPDLEPWEVEERAQHAAWVEQQEQQARA